MYKLFYPAIFHKAEDGGFWVTFPDIPECMTQGDDMQQAYEMAVEALGLALTSREAEKRKFLHHLNLIILLLTQMNFVLLSNLICSLIRNAPIPKQSKRLSAFLNGLMQKQLL